VHHVVLERWSRGDSLLHRRDARAKWVVTVLFLALVATAQPFAGALGAAYMAVLVFGLAVARLPVLPALARAALVLPFAGVFALAALLAGQPDRALELSVKAYISALAVLLLVGTTPFTALVRGLESLGGPRFLILVSQFVYRYLFVISEQAQHMRAASACRGGFSRRNPATALRAAAGAVSVLFARSYARAENIHRAMLSRGFQGRFHPLHYSRFKSADGVYLAFASALLIMLRLAIPAGV
jgi:cobalt/nickel transport system permease protein